MGLGGRAAEEVFFGRVTTGASSDLQQATRSAKAMVTQYGMSDKLGLPIYGEGSADPFLGRYYGGGSSRDYSEDAAKVIDEEVKRILGDQYQRAIDIIETNRPRMVAFVEKLLEVETVDRETFEAIMNLSLIHI